MTPLRSPFASLVALALAAAAPAQQGPRQDPPRQLEPLDMFRLDFLMQLPAEEPLAWLDAGHYLAFDAGPGAMPGRGTPDWWRVAARTGARERLFDQRALEASLAGLLGERADFDALASEDAWTWNDAHDRCVVDVAGDLFAAGLDGAAVRLTDTPDVEEVGVRFSPDGRNVAFVADHDLHVVPATGGDVRALTNGGHDDLFFGRLDWVYQEELYGRGNFQGYWWSPDGAHIAFLKLDESPVEEFVLVSDVPARPEVERTNYPKVGEPNPVAEIGVVAVADGGIRWFDVSDYPEQDRLIVRVTWAPDSKEVLFQVQDREQTWLDMRAGDVANGTSRLLWRETSDCWVEAGPEPVWIDGGASFLWLSERDGFRPLYRFARTGAPEGRLTEGRWQVLELVAVDEPNGVVWITADFDSPLESHLYRVPRGGAAPERVAPGRGTPGIARAPAHRTVIATR